MSEIKSIKSIIQQQNGLESKQILFKKNSKFKFEVPDKIKKDYSLVSKKWEEKDKKNSFQNQDSLCLSKFHINDNKLFLELCEEKYANRQAISETIGSLAAIDQDYLFSEINNGKVTIPLSYKINVGIISKDGQLIMVKRSQKVSTNKGKIDFGISKGVKPEDYNGRSFQPLVTALRATQEELNLSLDAKEIIKKEAFIIKEFYLNREIFSFSFLCIIDLRKLDHDYNAKKIIDLAAGAKNSWEFSDVFSIELNKKTLLKYFKTHLTKLTNYSLYHLMKISDDLK